MSDTEKNSSKIDEQVKYCAYLDILGFKDIIKDWKKAVGFYNDFSDTILALLGSLYENLGKLENEQIVEALQHPDKKVDFGLASPEPLILKDIVYDFEFEYPDKSLTELNNFEKRIVTSLR